MNDEAFNRSVASLEYARSLSSRRLPWFTVLGVTFGVLAWVMFTMRLSIGPWPEMTVLSLGLAGFALTAIASWHDRHCRYRRGWRMLEVFAVFLTLPWVMFALALLVMLLLGN